MAQLDEAERLAPRSVVVLQNRANVAYLMRDYPGAVRALRRALTLEPDNELFRRNLAQLERSITATPSR
jgi:Flp pilus assembly protein TadD